MAVSRQLSESVGATLSIGHQCLSMDGTFYEFIHCFSDNHANVQINVSEDNNFNSLCSKITAGSLDAGMIITKDYRTLEGYDYFPLQYYGYSVVVEKHHPLAAASSLCPADLRDEVLVVPDGKGMDLSVIFKSTVNREQHQPFIETDCLGSMLSVIVSGRGITVLPDDGEPLPRNLVRIPYQAGNRVARILFMRKDSSQILQTFASEACSFYRCMPTKAHTVSE